MSFQEADIIIMFEYGIGEPQTSTKSTILPLYNAKTGQTTYIPNTQSTTTFTRFAHLTAFEATSLREGLPFEIVWLTNISSTGSSGDLRRVMPILLAGAFNYIGIDTGKAVSTQLYENDTIIAEIKRPIELSKEQIIYEIQPEQDHGFTIKSGLVDQPYLGLNWKVSSQNEVVIIDVHTGTGAENAGVLKGDILLTVNSNNVNSNLDVFREIFKCFPGQAVTIKVRRESQEIEISYDVGTYKTTHHADFLTRLLTESTTINLAIIIGDIINVGLANDKSKDSWIQGIQQELLARTESEFLSFFRFMNGFNIVERNKIDALLSEYRLNLSGLVEDSIKIGQLAGATHILLVDLSRFLNKDYSSGYVDVVTQRLIDVETGKVVATVSIEYY